MNNMDNTNKLLSLLLFFFRQNTTNQTPLLTEKIDRLQIENNQKKSHKVCMKLVIILSNVGRPTINTGC